MSATRIIVPCFNEAARLRVDEYARFAGETDSIDLVFVDDGSTDDTWRILARMASRSGGRLGAMRLAENAGKGAAIRAGVRTAIAGGAEVVGYFDADLATPLRELLRLVEIRRDRGLDGVLGSRVGLLGYDVRRNPVRHYLGRAFGTAASALLDMPIYDSQCGAKVFAVTPALEAALASPFRTRWLFDLELLSRLQAADPTLRLEEVPLRHWVDVAGSKLGVRGIAEVAGDLALLARTRR